MSKERHTEFVGNSWSSGEKENIEKASSPFSGFQHGSKYSEVGKEDYIKGNPLTFQPESLEKRRLTINTKQRGGSHKGKSQ